MDIQCLYIYSFDGFQDEVTIHVGNTDMNWVKALTPMVVFMYVGIQQCGYIVTLLVTFQVGMYI